MRALPRNHYVCVYASLSDVIQLKYVNLYVYNNDCLYVYVYVCICMNVCMYVCMRH